MITSEKVIPWNDRAVMYALFERMGIDFEVNSGDIVLKQTGEYVKTVMRITFRGFYGNDVSKVTVSQYSAEEGHWVPDDSWDVLGTMSGALATWLEITAV